MNNMIDRSSKIENFGEGKGRNIRIIRGPQLPKGVFELTNPRHDSHFETAMYAMESMTCNVGAIARIAQEMKRIAPAKPALFVQDMAVEMGKAVVSLKTSVKQFTASLPFKNKRLKELEIHVSMYIHTIGIKDLDKKMKIVKDHRYFDGLMMLGELNAATTRLEKLVGEDDLRPNEVIQWAKLLEEKAEDAALILRHASEIVGRTV